VESVLRKQRTEKYTYKYTRMPKQVMEQRRWYRSRGGESGSKCENGTGRANSYEEKKKVKSLQFLLWSKLLHLSTRATECGSALGPPSAASKPFTTYTTDL
jgi:hypothetical protein